jgi:DeoR/GlpR family transcriptional regulator of sugar metabolism
MRWVGKKQDMIRSKILTEQRHRKILDLVQSQDVVTIDRLIDEFRVSQMTIWRDLTTLEQDGKVRRVRGGVTQVERASTNEPLYRAKRVVQQEAKRVIAQFAARNFIKDNDIIILEAGTTVGAMIEFINQPNLTVITNGLGNLDDLSLLVPGISVLSCGGMLRSVAYTFVGPQAESFLHNLRAHTLFLSSTGLAFPEGITDPSLLEIQVKRAMADSASRIVLLIDSTKFGVRSLAPIIPLDRIQAVVTDNLAPQADIDRLKGMGIEVFIAE